MLSLILTGLKAVCSALGLADAFAAAIHDHAQRLQGAQQQQAKDIATDANILQKQRDDATALSGSGPVSDRERL